MSTFLKSLKSLPKACLVGVGAAILSTAALAQAPLPAPEEPPEPVGKTKISTKLLVSSAYEKENESASIEISRDRWGNRTPVKFRIIGAGRAGFPSASRDDYTLQYAHNGNPVVGNRIYLKGNQRKVVINIVPKNDDSIEVPELLNFKLVGTGYYRVVGRNNNIVRINDAKNTAENQRVLAGAFRPENGAQTSAAGVASLVLSGDNASARLNYQFSGLSSPQFMQHIHSAPGGEIVFGFEDEARTGRLANLEWDLAPAGNFLTRQELLDAILGGEMYVNIHTENYRSGEIAAFFTLSGSNLPVPTPVPVGPLTGDQLTQDVVRFLNQATFGATESTVAALRNQINADGSNRLEVYEQWIDRQFELPQTSLRTMTEKSLRTFDLSQAYDRNRGWFQRRDAFWVLAKSGRDQLRLRTTFALSQIMVASESMGILRRTERSLSDYWDKIGRNSFGTYRGALGDVTRHPVMAQWLSYLRNSKAVPSRGISPDENYAREIMQLFTFGLVKRRPDGSIIIDPETNLPVPTYDNDVISELARSLTGYSFGVRGRQDGGVVENRQFQTGAVPGIRQERWIAPLKMFPQHHDFGRKELWVDAGQQFIVEGRGRGAQTRANAESEIDFILDGLVAHSTTAPNISQLLIQRFITSNPSPAYIERVSAAFGRTGDMKKVIKAILLDDEARNVNVFASEGFGKVKEPVIAYTQLLRLLDAKSEVPLGTQPNGIRYTEHLKFEPNATLMRLGGMSLGQAALSSPTVFNFYLPDYTPPGDIARNGMVAPEMQINTESQTYDFFNEIDALLYDGKVEDRIFRGSGYTEEQLRVRVDLGRLRAVFNRAQGDRMKKAEAVVDYLDNYINAGYLRATGDIGTRLTIIDAVANSSGDEKYRLAVYLMATAPKSMIQR